MIPFADVRLDGHYSRIGLRLVMSADGRDAFTQEEFARLARAYGVTL